jgi:hypothetical protein
MFRRIRRKRSIAALSVVAVLALAGGAYAYFSSNGSGTGTAGVGTSSPFVVTPGTAIGTLYPGGSAVTIPFSVKNNSQGYQNVAAIAATMASANGDIVHGSTEVTNCLASWFTPTPVNPTPAADLAPGATYSGSVTVQMIDSGTNQDVCKSASPDVTISAS